MHDFSTVSIEAYKEDVEALRELFKTEYEMLCIGDDGEFDDIETCLSINESVLIQIDFEDLKVDMVELVEILSESNLSKSIHIYTFGEYGEIDADIVIDNNEVNINGCFNMDRTNEETLQYSKYKIAYRLFNQVL